MYRPNRLYINRIRGAIRGVGEPIRHFRADYPAYNAGCAWSQVALSGVVVEYIMVNRSGFGDCFDVRGCWSRSGCLGVMYVLVFDRGEHPDGAVSPLAVVEYLNVFEHLLTSSTRVFHLFRFSSSVCMRPQNDSMTALS